MDGVAGANFHEILLQNFSFIETKPEEYNTKYGSVGVGVLFDYTLDKDKIVYSLPPPIDYFLQDYNLDYSSDPTHFCKAIPEGTTKWPGLHLAKRDYEISYNIINFTPSEVSKILKQCKERKVTLTSYITIMHALTVTPIIGDDHYSVYKIALNLRRHLNPNAIQTEEYKHDLQDKSHFALGCSSHMGYPQNIGPIRKFSWDDVVKVNVNLLETVSNDRALNFSKAFIDTASLHDDNLPYFQSFLGKPRPDTVKVSNIGCVRAKAEKGWEITDMIFAQDMAIIAAEFQFNIVSTPLGGLNFVWCYIKDNGQVCEGYASKLKQNMLSIL